MIHAGPGPLIMFLEDWVIRLTVVEDGPMQCESKQSTNQTFSKLHAEM